MKISVEAARIALAKRALAKSPVILAEKVAGIRPDPWQRTMLEKPWRRLIVLASRQSGKSTMAGLLALHEALFKPKSLTIMIAPSQRQSRELFRKTQTAWEQLLQWGRAQGLNYKGPWPEAIEDNALSIGFDNGARIVALPASAETVRGFSAVTLYIEDEAAFVSDELYRSMRPMLAVSHGRLALLSTPYGQNGHFWEEWSGVGDWERIRVRASECPRIPAEFLEEERKSLGERMFAQEYEAEFTSGTAALWTRESIERSRVSEAPKCIAYAVGVDPSVGDKESNDEQGIHVAGIDAKGHIYAIEDVTVKLPPAGWGHASVTAAVRHKPTATIYVERNAGGDMAKHVIEVAARDAKVDVTVSDVLARHGKHVRAEPVSAIWEQGRGHIVGKMEKLEGELCGMTTAGYTGAKSPNRADAFVWACLALLEPDAMTGATRIGSVSTEVEAW